MKLQEAAKYFKHACNEVLDADEADEIFLRVVESFFSISRLEIKTNRSLDINEAQLSPFIESLKKHIPIQYILGEEWFMDLRLKVNNSVLIPRPETAELVLWLLKTIRDENLLSAQIIDIGTGSGCIAIACKHSAPTLMMHAIDISNAALEVAKENAALYQCDIEFCEMDILSGAFQTVSQFDLIVSNPPYITVSESIDMLPNVLKHEPNNALFVSNDDPLQFYKAILKFADQNLKPGGYVFFELNVQFAHETENLFKQADYQTELKQDMYGNLRMLKCKKTC
ncbi:MAG: peptide chain release factor N(5)-glutamine methyltransferase [Bacteroidetes bacterium]|nr:peptide chain release factor N(5)-glutamine methyltransferase [Bacteroidota bacterium]